MIEMAHKFGKLDTSEYPESVEDSELKEPVAWAIKNGILDKNYYLNFYVFDRKKVDGDPGTGPILFKDSYDWENEEYKGDYNWTFYSDICSACIYFACETLYKTLPEEAKIMYRDALFEELQYTLDDEYYDDFKREWVANFAHSAKDGREEERQILEDLIDKYEDELKALICYGFEFQE